MGLLDVFGKIAQIGGMGASMAGLPMVGVPLSVAGGAMSGASDGGGIKGGLVGGATSAASQAMSGGLQKGLGEMLKPVDTGAFTAFSSKGSPLTVPGARSNPIDVSDVAGKPFTAPASPTTIGGS